MILYIFLDWSWCVTWDSRYAKPINKFIYYSLDNEQSIIFLFIHRSRLSIIAIVTWGVPSESATHRPSPRTKPLVDVRHSSVAHFGKPTPPSDLPPSNKSHPEISSPTDVVTIIFKIFPRDNMIFPLIFHNLSWWYIYLRYFPYLLLNCAYLSLRYYLDRHLIKPIMYSLLKIHRNI